MRVRYLSQSVMDSPELDPEGNGLVDGELTTSHHPLLIMGKEDSRTGTSGKKGFYEVNGNTFTEEEGKNNS